MSAASGKATAALLLALLVGGGAAYYFLGGAGDGGNKPLPPPAEPTGGMPFAYTDVAEEMGYVMRNRSGKEGQKEFILEAMPPGIAVADFDGDGWMDMYCPNGNNITAFDRQKDVFRLLPADLAPRNAMYWNQQGRSFKEGAAAAGVDDSRWSFGAVAGDLDNDGRPDIYLCNWGQNRLYRNLGNGKFEDVGPKAGVTGSPRDWSTGACLFDYDQDGDLDIYVAQYADVHAIASNPLHATIDARGRPHARTCDWEGIQVYCGPLGLIPVNDVLYKNLLQETGELKFQNVTRAAGLWFELDERSATESSMGPFYAFQPVAWDINRDGLQDVFVANDSVNNTAWINNGDGTFTDQAEDLNLAMSFTDAVAQASMGVGIGDINRDGLQDVTVTEFSHDHFNLLIARALPGGDVIFNETALKSGLRQLTFYKLGWGALVYDADLDRDLDIFYACGHVYPEVDVNPAQRTAYKQRNLLLLNVDPNVPRYEDVTDNAGPGMQIARCTRAAARIDFDNDGDIDIATTELNDIPVLLRCDLQRKPGTHNWVMFQLRGKPAAKVPLDPAGAEISVTTGDVTQTQVLHIGSSFECSEDPRLHFGLGDATVVDRVEILWPNGKRQVLQKLPAGKLHRIDYAPGE
ncbi:MAG: CRTAC1 family protein [Planctomycetota bacterium]|nr:CRTAC1 family protein [Planctomycetota bacterium]